MNPSYKWKYDEMRGNQPADKGEVPAENKGADKYEGIGHMRALCFVWTDGRRIFLNYAYLISAEHLPDEGIIKLSFTTHLVLLKGIRLEGLFEELMSQITRRIVCTDERYASIQEDKSPVVTTIDLVEITAG